VNKKARTRKKPLSVLTPTEVAEIDGLIERRWWQQEQEGAALIRKDEDELKRLLRVSADTPWPKQLGPGITSGGDGYLYVRKEKDLSDEQRALVVEVARRDGVIRYALATGDGPSDLSQYWSKRDAGWDFVMSRLQGVHVDDFDRTLDQAIDELLDTNITAGPYTRAYIKYDRHARVNPKRRAHDQKRALASSIDAAVKWLTDLLQDAGFVDAKMRAEAFMASHWRKVVNGRSRFATGPALNTWLRTTLKR
jgi:hypothetical protein